MKQVVIPDFQSIMLPFLKILGDGKKHTLKEMIQRISDVFELTEDQRKEMVPSGGQFIISNRINWVRTYLYKAALIDIPERGVYIITNEGQNILQKNLPKINTSYLKKLPAFQEWQNSYKIQSLDNDIEVKTDKTPFELLEYSFSQINDELAFELLKKVKQCTASFFEKLVVDLLVKMGYGGSDGEGQVVGKVGDGGIDGTIRQDKLGLDMIYIQAKKWENQVTISSIRDFAGSLLSKKAKKGVFITTSTFPLSAYEYINTIEPRIVLIDGKQLAKLMIDYNVGLDVQRVYEIKRLDLDYFEEM